MPKGVYERRPTPDRSLGQLLAGFWSKVELGPSCWTWTAALTRTGYGVFWIGPPRRMHVRAHRFAYETEIGPVPAGSELDHLCRNRACVRPDHLEVVTHRENMRRARRDSCHQGHPFTGDNLYVKLDKTGVVRQRVCRTCMRAFNRAYHRRKADAIRI